VNLQNGTRHARRAAGLGNCHWLVASDTRILHPKSAPNQAENNAQCEEVARRLRLQFLAGRLHALGPKPLFNFLDEIERGADLQSHLERYAALPADFIRPYGGDQFPKLFAIRKGRR
jgi:hypothetical protein